MGSTEFEYDAIVVGSGAGGACAAFEMTAAGMKVLMLEKGPLRELADFYAGGVFAPGFNSAGRGDELKYIQSTYLMPDLRKEVRFLTYSEPGNAAPPTSGKTSDGWMSQLVGGGTVHYGGASFRFEHDDFRMKSIHGEKCAELEPQLDAEHRADLRDWPLSPDEMEFWYERAESLIGIAGAHGGGLPALPYSKAGRLLDEALKGAKYDVQLIPTPMAINSQAHMGRVPCQNSGLCQDFACRFEAKSDMRVTLLRRALETGNLKIQPKTFVRRVLASKGQVSGVECVAGRDDAMVDEVVLPATLVIVACETIETNRLLMASNMGTEGVIGRYLMFHMTGGARAIAPEKTTTWETAPHTAFTMGIYEHFDHSKQSPFLKTGILMVSSNGGPLADVVRKRYWGEEAKLYFNYIYPYKFDLSYIGDCMPTKYNRVELRRDQLDRFGMPGTEVFYRPHPFDMNASKYAAAKAKEMLTIAGGATEDNAPDYLKPFLRKKPTARQLYHCTGGARMGEDARESVVTPDCEVHGISNLFVVDGSVFPTGSGLNPTLTIQANALRIGELIAKRASRAGA
jgi:choline dehydrogenase-like flavoprotein